MLSFLLACIIIELTPGPNMTYVAALSSVNGTKAGFSLVGGIAAGLLLVGVIAGSGAAALIAESPVLYHALRWGGVGYMLWLAWESWRGEEAETAPAAGFDVRYFRRGFITNVLNPKAAIFYITVFPAFINPAVAEWRQWTVLVLFYVCVATLVHSALVLLGGRISPLLENPARAKMIRRFFSVLLFFIACWFAWSTRKAG